ncbi:hypothetical protein M514_08543 [Trichuris suis]|uniref:tRNA-5-taurinomethyluridine 2-sulfurtransferase n=1 Tax=Trichuris suis TaxID=68888 RepID=A0A085NDZ2_9BILA|nr:hypothetical protein M513_08543 [Trichuris suis]KFD67688.1 hypothetical protein M514_08543 [Trichuris suis]
MGKVVSSLYRSFLNIGVERRVERWLEKGPTGQPPPHYPAEEAVLKELKAQHPEFEAYINEKPTEMLERIKQLDVEKIVEHEHVGSRRLPPPSHMSIDDAEVPYRFVEPPPDRIPPGKITLSRLVKLLDEMQLPEADISKLAAHNALSEEAVRKISKHFGVFTEGTDEQRLPPVKLAELNTFGPQMTLDEVELKLLNAREQVEKARKADLPKKEKPLHTPPDKRIISLQRMFKKVACAISGGIDSAVAAYLLKERGFDVIGVYMHNWDLNEEGSSCTSSGDLLDASKVADHLELPLHRVEFVRQYWLDVFSHTVESYRLGISANPDVLCNRFIKFGSFFRYAMNRLRVDAIASGHYARSSFGGYLEQYSPSKKVALLRPKDRFKDQTYFLCQIAQSALAKTMFPLATLLKDEVRELARRVGLGWLCAKPESFGICMVGPRRFPTFIDQYIEPKQGKLIDVDTGEIVHEHKASASCFHFVNLFKGIHLFTIGQRVGIGGLDHGYYVTKICPDSGDIYVCACNFHPAMYSRALFTAEPHWISDEAPEMPKRYSLKTRHPSRTVPCLVSRLKGSNNLYIQLDFPARALSSGQYAVLYDGDECLGGACIERTEPLLVRAVK